MPACSERLCGILLSDRTPDLPVLDEPTNHLDIESLAILTDTIRNYRGTLSVISHDYLGIRAIGTPRTVELRRNG